MNTTSLVSKHFLIPSPFEVFTYIIDIPHINKNLIKAAVDYKLRSLYPGPENTFVSDYRANGKQSPAFVVQKEILAVYKQKKLPILSFDLAAAYIQQNGMALCITDSWIQITLIKNSYPAKKIFCIPDKLQTLFPLTDTDFTSLKNPDILIYNFAEKPDLEKTVKKLLNSTYTVIRKGNIENLETKKVLKNCTIFRDPPKKVKLHIFHIAAATLCLFAVSCDTYLYTAYKKEQTHLSETKKLYQKEKQKIAELQLNGKEEQTSFNAGTENTSCLPVYEILDTIYKSNTSLKINSLTISETSFQLTAEGVPALPVLENLKTSPLFSDVFLQQAVPSDFQGELFTISGKIKHD